MSFTFKDGMISAMKSEIAFLGLLDGVLDYHNNKRVARRISELNEKIAVLTGRKS